MAAKHGTRRRYVEGCRCDECAEAQREYQRDYRARRANGLPTVSQLPRPWNTDPDPELSGPGRVEAGVEAEIAGLTEARPGLVQAALALARVMDNPRAVSSHPAAAKVLAGLLDTLRKGAARGRRGGLAVVRALTEPSVPRSQ
jgi:hypothetical protein